MAAQFPPCPVSLRSIQHYLKTAAEHDQRDPVVSYWCRLYALQCGLKIDRKSDEAKMLLGSLMDWLETQKKALSDNEAITNDVAAQAHLENYALKLFLCADGMDRAANFGKNVVRTFYTAGMLFDVLQIFGELTEEVTQNRKYAKWKAAYIHNCLKNGEEPLPGPMPEGEGMGEDDNEDEEGATGGTGGGTGAIGFVQPPAAPDFQQPPPSIYIPPSPVSPSSGLGPFISQPIIPTTPTSGTVLPSSPSTGNTVARSEGSSVVLNPDQINKAQKYCKWASSALNYDDTSTAIMNLQKALILLQTGNDS